MTHARQSPRGPGFWLLVVVSAALLGLVAVSCWSFFAEVPPPPLQIPTPEVTR